MEFKLSQNMIDELTLFTKLLNKDHNTILNEALTLYFENEQKKLLEKRLDDENAMTNLDFDEFWDGVDI
jgi:hypothetical protein